MVLGLWVFGAFPTSQDSPGLLGQSQKPGTVPGFWVSDWEITSMVLGLRVFADSPNVPGLSQASWTVTEAWDYPSLLGSLRLRNKLHGVGTLGLWDSPKGLGLSRASATVPKSWDCPRLLGLCQRPSDPGTVPKTRSPTCLRFYFYFLSLGQSQSLGLFQSQSQSQS